MTLSQKIIKFFNKVELSLGVVRPKIVVLHFTKMDIDSFVRQINFLEDLDYKFVFASEIAEYVRGTREINHHSVALTFDTQNQDILQFAIHFLETRGVSATVYLRSNTQKTILDRYKNMKNWQIGSLGINHTDLSSKNAYFRKEIIESKQILEERLSRNILTFAYPNGKFCKYAQRNIEKAGYLAAFSLRKGFITKSSNFTRLQRVEINKKTDMIAFDSCLRQWRRAYWFLERIFSISSRVKTTQGELSGFEVDAAGLSP